MATDTFTNSNSTGLSTHNALWVTPTGSSQSRIYNNTATTWENDSTWYAMYWNATVANAHYAEAVVSSGQDNIGGPAVRVQSAANSCYVARWASNTVQAGEVIAGSFTAWGSTYAVTAGDVIRLEADASTPTTFYLKKNGVTVETNTSKSTLTGGKYGICTYADANLTGIASWEGGDVAGSSPVGAGMRRSLLGIG